MPILETFALYCQSLDLLVQQKNWRMVLRTLEKAVSQAKALHQYQTLGAVLSKVPLSVMTKSANLALWFQILAFGRHPKTVLALYLKLSEQKRQPYKDMAAWAYWRENQPQRAWVLLEQQDSGLAWRLRGQLSVGKTGWQEYFQKAIQKLQGRALGICHMEFGNACFMVQDLSTAQTQYNLAYAILKKDRYYGAWIKYNLGLAALELGLPEAETHLFEVYRQSQHPEATAFEARAWAGLGAARRSYGEWERAVYAYQKAAMQSQELDDLLDALCGLAQTWRCMERLNDALEVLQEAIDRDHTGEKTNKIRVLLAATHLQRGEVSEAQKWLGGISNPTGETVLRLRVLEGEFLRLEKQKPTLQDLPLERRCIQDEMRCFPELFQTTAQKSLPLHTQIRALGVLEVRVNQRPWWLKPTSRAAELLVFLLENAGHASSEAICAALFPSITKGRNAEKTLWATAQQLRDAFGWETSIQNSGKAYILDSSILRHYDASTATNKSRLLEGVYSDWLEEVRRS